MVTVTDYKFGYHIEHLVSLVLSVMRSKHITRINEVIKQRQSTSPKIKYFPIEFDIDGINKDAKYMFHTIETTDSNR